jgi:hypothetical protein
MNVKRHCKKRERRGNPLYELSLEKNNQKLAKAGIIYMDQLENKI